MKAVHNPLSAGRESVADGPLLHSIDAVCKRLSMGRSWIYAEIAAGRISAVKLGRRTLIAESEIQRIVAQAVAA